MEDDMLQGDPLPDVLLQGVLIQGMFDDQDEESSPVKKPERSMLPEERLANAVLSNANAEAKKLCKGESLERYFCYRENNDAHIKYEARRLLNWISDRKEDEGSLAFWCDIAGMDAAPFRRAMLKAYGNMLRAKARGEPL